MDGAAAIDGRRRPRRAGRWREAALALVTVCGVVQTLLVYTDAGGAPTSERLAPAAARGLALWRAHNCQVCHQLYGFGGFLGPDLTNVLARSTADDLSSVLSFGRNRMPRFDFTRSQQADLVAFLRVLDRSGQAQPTPLRPLAPVPDNEHFGRLVAAHAAATGAVPEPVRRGARLIDALECGACHRPLAPGRLEAPDLTLVAGSQPRDRLRTSLVKGRNSMPGYTLADAEYDAILDALAWMRGVRTDLVATDDALVRREAFAWSEVPWFEYR